MLEIRKIRQRYVNETNEIGRDDRIRTCDPLTPSPICHLFQASAAGVRARQHPHKHCRVVVLPRFVAVLGNAGCAAILLALCYHSGHSGRRHTWRCARRPTTLPKQLLPPHAADDPTPTELSVKPQSALTADTPECEGLGQHRGRRYRHRAQRSRSRTAERRIACRVRGGRRYHLPDVCRLRVSRQAQNSLALRAPVLWSQRNSRDRSPPANPVCSGRIDHFPCVPTAPARKSPRTPV